MNDPNALEPSILEDEDRQLAEMEADPGYWNWRWLETDEMLRKAFKRIDEHSNWRDKWKV
jgi:hypothetical protein